MVYCNCIICSSVLSGIINSNIMFIASDNEIREFAETLISLKFQNSVLRALEEQDEKQIRFMKLSMSQKMPIELQSQKYATSSKVGEKQGNISFPRMFEQGDKKNYEYIDDDLENIKRIAGTFSQFPKMSTEQSQMKKAVQIQAELQEGEEIEPKVKLMTEGEVKQQHKQGQKELQKPSSKAKSSSKPPSIRQPDSFGRDVIPSKCVEPSRVNPFIANNLNFMDPHANSKALQIKQSYLNFTQNSRNIASLAQKHKFNAFSESVSYPTSVMSGTVLAPKQSSFSRQARLDVGDVMRYTLGVKKTGQQKKPIQNPFHRPPKKRNE